MIQQAFISGQLGMAIYTDNRQRMVLNAEDLSQPSQCTGHDLSMFFHSGAEFSLLTEPVKDLQQLAGSLERETQAHTALTLVLCSMDPSLDETRPLSIEAAEELLKDDYVHGFVKRRLLARPLPDSADMKGAQSGAANVHALSLVALLGTVQQSQSAIQSVLQAWNHATREHFATPEQAADAESSLIELGVFAELVSAMAQESPEKLNALVVKFGLDRRISASVPRVTHLLNAMKNSLNSSLAHLPDARPFEVEAVDEGIRSAVRDLLSEFEEDRTERSRKAMSSLQAKARVDVQIDSIAGLIREHDLRKAEEWLEDLVRFQVSQGKKKFLAMSLCNLATVAIASREFDFAGVLVEHAVALGIEDPVVFTVRAEILRAKTRFPEALEAYNEAARLFPHDAFARNGRAEVLKAMGRFPEALEAYDEAARLFPNDAVARTGHAEVLKAMGRFNEALGAYDEAARLFPENAIARTGRAEVLKAMGRFPEALEAYDEAARLFPNDAFARNGRAEVLKAMGRFPEALEAYNEAARLFPESAFARTGRAEVLKAIGRFNEALGAYDEAARLFPENAIARTSRAEVLKAMGRFNEALGAYDEAARLFPNDAVARNGRAEVLKAMGRFPEALEAYDEAARLFPESAFARTGRAEALKAMGRFPEALEAYDEAARLFPENAVARNGRAEVLKAMGRFPEALEAYDEAARLFPESAFARNGRAEVLKAMGRFNEALGAYDEAARLFPNDAVARNGRAEVLKAMGRFPEALEAYDEAARLFPESAFARTGRAEALKAMGRFPEALEAYDEAARLFPENAVARNGRAEVLKAMGRFPEALEAYDEAARLFPNDAVARNGRAEVLKAMGHFDEALDAYNETRIRFPYNEYARCGAASVLVLTNRTDEARALLSPEFPPVSQRDWIRYHILSMIYVKSGTNLDEAIRRLTHGSQHAPWQETRQRFVNALAVAWIKRTNYREALQVLQRDMEVLEALEKQKRLVLIGHSYAATDAPEEAVKTLTGIANVSDPNLASLRSLLFERYSLGGQRVVPVNPAALNFKIAQHEFALAMA